MEAKMKQNTVETIVGLFVLSIATWFLIYAFHTNRMNTNSEGYFIQARFQNADGINEGSDIVVAGIKIGEVEEMTLDRKDFYAVMTLKINQGIKLPKDSQAGVVSSGFLGGKYVSIIPGVEDEDLKDGDTIALTHSSVNLESLIGKFMYSFGNK
jgi:phospholipid/cholesterol/gamma-HCH transport system substrate-binding protein